MPNNWMVYVAQPMDQASGYQTPTWKVPDNWTLYRPNTAFSNYWGSECVNRSVLTAVDALLAFLPRGVPTIGVPAEIEQALSIGIPVAIVSDIDNSVALRGFEQRGACVTFRVSTAIKWLQTAMPDAAPRDGVGFVKRSPSARLPTRGYSDDVGLDLYASEQVVVPVYQFRDVPTGVVCNIPSGLWAFVTARSSAMRKHRLWITPGVIDPSFRGELYVGVWNINGSTHVVQPGDRLAQLILLPATAPVPFWAGAVTEGVTPRGESGFGSTG